MRPWQPLAAPRPIRCAGRVRLSPGTGITGPGRGLARGGCHRGRSDRPAAAAEPGRADAVGLRDEQGEVSRPARSAARPARAVDGQHRRAERADCRRSRAVGRPCGLLSAGASRAKFHPGGNWFLPAVALGFAGRISRGPHRRVFEVPRRRSCRLAATRPMRKPGSRWPGAAPRLIPTASDAILPATACPAALRACGRGRRVEVGCEACHGPSAAHVGDPKARTALYAQARDRCESCHDRENSPQFAYAAYWARDPPRRTSPARSREK